MSHALSLADRGESWTGCAANGTPSYGTGPFLIGWSTRIVRNVLNLKRTKRGWEPLLT